MTSKYTLSITEGRKRLFDIAKQVQCPGIHYMVTKRGKPQAVLVSFKEFKYLVSVLKLDM